MWSDYYWIRIILRMCVCILIGLYVFKWVWMCVCAKTLQTIVLILWRITSTLLFILLFKLPTLSALHHAAVSTEPLPRVLLSVLGHSPAHCPNPLPLHDLPASDDLRIAASTGCKISISRIMTEKSIQNIVDIFGTHTFMDFCSVLLYFVSFV